jgi:hypothetical protein
MRENRTPVYVLIEDLIDCGVERIELEISPMRLGEFVLRFKDEEVPEYAETVNIKGVGELKVKKKEKFSEAEKREDMILIYDSEERSHIHGLNQLVSHFQASGVDTDHLS